MNKQTRSRLANMTTQRQLMAYGWWNGLSQPELASRAPRRVPAPSNAEYSAFCVVLDAEMVAAHQRAAA